MDYPSLDVLFGAYLNEDFFDDYADLDTAIAEFGEHDPEHAVLAPVEIEKLVANSDDAELERAVLRLGLGIDGGAGTLRAWLMELENRLRASLGQ